MPHFRNRLRCVAVIVPVAAIGLVGWAPAMMTAHEGHGAMPPVHEEHTMATPTTQTPAVLANYVGALNDHNPDGAAAAYTEDAVVAQAVLNGNTFTGREQIAGWVRDNLAGLPDLEVTVGRISRSGDLLIWEWTYSGTYTGQFPGAPKGEGQQVALQGVSVMELSGDLIARETLYYDNQSFLSQIGAA